ncbi:transmembrane and coiled-coil domain-containing protein 4 [Dorcoceras hygrometricum]|uniref:Transmembrane and coiled-coil domain-containing protein 4 n=1 Tax=Dorcoceras hygrometricum TaxID=472368 RepID=A0A2Z7ADS5_9LAMI|nr:transmembrane and coiled-coil domain-containing protein 4 [Dorcoceras hygrometricum]
MKKELEDTQVALEASHKVIAGLTEIGLSMSKKIERMKVKKQKVRENHVECHQKFQARIGDWEEEPEEEPEEEEIEDIPLGEGEIDYE